MRIHLHTLCWNDRPLLEFFFRHYAPWVDRFYILDDHSSDGTREYMANRADVVLGDLKHVNPESWVLSAQQIYNTAWKKSTGEADWVVVTNIDEHLYHPDMSAYLASLQKQGVTVVPALGYQMITTGFPRPGSLLWRDHRFGAPWVNMSKAGIFQPDHVNETNYSMGRHRADFKGRVVFPGRDETVNLHYKYLGTEYTQKRHEELAERLGSVDRRRNWGHKYHWDEGQLQADFEQYRQKLVDIAVRDHHVAHTLPRWWRSNR